MRRGPLFALLAVALISGALEGQSGWNDSTHGRNAVPDYDRVFAQDEVKRLDIQVTAADWARLVEDMASMAGTTGGGNVGGQPPPTDPARIAACVGRVEAAACTFGAPPQSGRCTLLPMGGGLTCTPLAGGGGGGGGGQPGGNAEDVDLLPRTPIYIPAHVTFDNVRFEHVGFRLKGNSSLVNSWRQGSEKLPWRLNFDVFEGQYPSIRDQTFFGFPNLSLTSNSQDVSFMRAKVVGDLFREAGVASPRTAFVRVFLDRGAGASYLGVYTLIETPGDPMLEAFFSSGDGNLYKPAGTGARWTVFIEDSFPKMNNAQQADWTDIEDAIAVLNESRANASVWRTRLEARFAVSPFLRWLGLNTIIGNTDTYGGFSPHNYYLYGSPRHRDRLFFMPWDHDLALNSGLGGGGAAPGTVDVFHAGVNATWPLIRFLLDDPTYRAVYRRHVQELLDTVFVPARLVPRIQAETARITPYVIGPEGEQPGRTFVSSPAAFTQATANLLAYIQARSDVVRQALAAAP